MDFFHFLLVAKLTGAWGRGLSQIKSERSCERTLKVGALLWIALEEDAMHPMSCVLPFNAALRVSYLGYQKCLEKIPHFCRALNSVAPSLYPPSNKWV